MEIFDTVPDAPHIKLGNTYSDKVTGFTGEATAFVAYLYSTDSAQLTPQNPEHEARWFDVFRLEPVE